MNMKLAQFAGYTIGFVGWIMLVLAMVLLVFDQPPYARLTLIEWVLLVGVACSLALHFRNYMDRKP